MNDETRAWVQSIFGDPAPRDVVRGPGPAREDYLRWNGMAGTWTEGTRAGELVEDVDGTPLGVSPSRPERVHCDVAVTTRELARVGLTPDEVPNLTIVDEPTKREELTNE